MNGRTYAPVRYLAEYFGYKVSWDGTTNSVLIAASTVHRYTDDELVEMAKAYYFAKYGSSPPFVDVDVGRGEGTDMVTLHLYEIADNHIATWEWYIVSRVSATGTGMFSGYVDLTEIQ